MLHRKKHILHVITSLSVGGAELMLVRLARELDEQGAVEQLIVSLGPIDLEKEHLADLQPKVISLGLRGLRDLPGCFFRLVKIMRQWKPDIVQSWLYHADLIAGLAARLSGVQDVYWGIRCVETPSNSPSTTKWVVRVCALLSYLVPTKIVCCAYAAEKKHIDIGYDRRRTVVIPNGFELDRFAYSEGNRARARRLFGASSDRVVIGLVARFDPLKDHHTFIAAAGLVAAVKKNVDFVLIGKGTTHENGALMAWIADSGLNGRITLLGERLDVAELMSGLDVFCLSSKSEGFPNSLGEAMAIGLPCVSTDVGDVRHLLQDAGLVVPPSDPKALAAAFDTMVNKPAEERQRLGDRARAIILANFGLDTIANEYADLYALAGTTNP